MADRFILTNTAAAQLRLEYDIDSYADFTVDASGNLLIAPIGGGMVLNGNVVGLGRIASYGDFFAGVAYDGSPLIFEEAGTARGSVRSGVWILGSGAVAGNATAGGIRASGTSQFDAAVHVTGRLLATGGVRTTAVLSPSAASGVATTVLDLSTIISVAPEGSLILVSAADNPGHGASKFLAIVTTSVGAYFIAQQSGAATMTFTTVGANLQLTHTLPGSIIFRLTVLLIPQP
jgi:hypothetical protein